MKKFLVHCATVIVALTASQSWAQSFQSIFSFPTNGAQGTKPSAALTIGPDGSLYGTASEGGAANAGTAFKISTVGAFASLGSFDPAETGKSSVARMVSIGDGFLYGVTSDGTGTAGDPLGTLFRLNPAGGDTPAGGLTKIFALPGGGVTPKRPHALVSGEANVLHVLGNSPGGIWRVPLDGGMATDVFTFASSDDGLFPESVIRGSDGNLYGVTRGTSFVDTTAARQGTVFKIAPNGSGFATIHDCDLPTGVAPIGAMVEGPDGSFYGTTSAGGQNSDGVIFRLQPSGGGFNYTVLHSINDQPPTGDLLLASDGKLYGISEAGGQNLYGSIFRINPNGTGFQVIHSFNKTNGAYPKGGLVQATDGNLYGVTEEGGANDLGTIFRIDLDLPVPEVNRRPIAIDDQGFSSGLPVVVNVLGNDFDPDEDALTVTIETMPSAGMVTVQGDGSIKYEPTLGLGYDGFDQFSYRVTDPDGLFALATVTVSDETITQPWQPGTYNGVLNLDPALTFSTDTPRGQLIITIQASGLFTGTLFTNGKRLPVRGVFDESGSAVAVVKASKKKKALMFLARGDGNSLLAVVFGQEQLSGFVLPLVLPDSPVTAGYTAFLEPTFGNLPAGSGFGVARVLPNGLVVVVGRLPDGSRIGWGTTLVTDGVDTWIPVFNAPVRGGFCSGMFTTSGADGFQGEVNWFRPPTAKLNQPYPAGFSGTMLGFMTRYTKPARGETPVNFGIDQAGTVRLSSPTIDPPVSGDLTVQGSRLIPGGALKSFSISRATGLFKGKMKVGSKSVGFQGAVIQSARFGTGYFTLDGTAGVVLLDADAPL